MHLPSLVKIYPSAKILHIIRDGRAVAASWAAHPFGAGNLYVAARQWKERVLEGRRSGRALGDASYLEVRYEELLASTEETMRGVYAFLDEPPPPQPPQLNPLPLAASDPGWRGVSHTEIVTDNADAWRVRMSRADVCIVESVAGNLLTALGYEVEGAARPLPPWRRGFWNLQSTALHYARQFRRMERLRDNLALFVARRRHAAAG